MTTMQIQVEAFQNLGIIAQDETVLERVAKYLRRIAKQLMDDPTCMSEEEFRQKLERSSAAAEAGFYVEKSPQETMEQFLDRVCM